MLYRLTKFCMDDSETPMTAEELKNKFMSLCLMTISADTATRIYDNIMDIDALDSIKGLTGLFQ